MAEILASPLFFCKTDFGDNLLDCLVIIQNRYS